MQVQTVDTGLPPLLISCPEGMVLCVEWRHTNTGWHINVHHMELFCTQIIECEAEHNGDIGILEWSTYIGDTVKDKGHIFWRRYAQITLVFMGVPFCMTVGFGHLTPTCSLLQKSGTI